MIEQFYNSGYIIDWLQFIEDAKNIGWKSDTIFKRIQYALDEVDIDDKDIILEKIKKHI